jgi:hypothetical protein
VGGYASYVVPAAFVLILQQTLLIGAAMLTGTALAGASGAFSGVLGRGVAHLTIYLLVASRRMVAFSGRVNQAPTACPMKLVASKKTVASAKPTRVRHAPDPPVR